MPVSVETARDFVGRNARVVDRRLLETVLDGASPDGLRRAVDAYRNADGGYGHALEPDKRAPASQPLDVSTAFETFALAGVEARDEALAACRFLGSVADERGAL